MLLAFSLCIYRTDEGLKGTSVGPMLCAFVRRLRRAVSLGMGYRLERVMSVRSILILTTHQTGEAEPEHRIASIGVRGGLVWARGSEQSRGSGMMFAG